MGIDQVSVLHLRYFLAIIDHGSVVGAARSLHVAQPSLSQQVRQLERWLNLQLFERSPHGMAPTSAGDELATAARQWLAALSKLSGDPLPVTVGTPRGIDSACLDLVRKRLGGRITFTPCDTAAAPNALQRHEIDAAVVHAPVETNAAGLRITELLSRHLGIWASIDAINGSPDSGKSIEIRALDGVSLLWFTEHRSPAYARNLLDQIHEAGWYPTLVPLDPASDSITTNYLRHTPGVVALRPQPTALADGLGWWNTTPALTEILFLAQRA